MKSTENSARLRLEPETPKNLRVLHANHAPHHQGRLKSALKIVKYKGIVKMITFKILSFKFVVYVAHM